MYEEYIWIKEHKTGTCFAIEWEGDEDSRCIHEITAVLRDKNPSRYRHLSAEEFSFYLNEGSDELPGDMKLYQLQSVLVNPRMFGLLPWKPMIFVTSQGDRITESKYLCCFTK